MPIPSRRTTRAALAALTLAALVTAGLAAREWPAWCAARAARRALAEARWGDAAEAAARWARLRPQAAEAHYLRARAGLALGSPRDVGDGLVQAERLGIPA